MLEKDPGDPDVPLNVMSKAAANLCFFCLPARSVSGQEFTGKQWKVMDLTLLQL